MLEFLGCIRPDPVAGAGPVSAIAYEAYAPMAERILADLEQAVARQSGAAVCCIRHSIGAVKAGEASLWVGVAAKHRAEAFEALRLAVERIKAEAPVWKWEVFAGGEGVIQSARHSQAESDKLQPGQGAGRWVEGNTPMAGKPSP